MHVWFILVIVLCGISSILLVIVIWTLSVFIFTKVPYVKTPIKNISTLLDSLKITDRDIVYDLGCGNAEVLIEIERLTYAATLGFEISPFAFIMAKINIYRKKSSTRLLYRDFRNQDLSDATIVFFFSYR